MARRRIGVLGMGHVGKQVAAIYGPKNDIVTYDPQFDSTYPTDELAACDVTFVCVGTPKAADGRCDTSMVEGAVEQLPCPSIVIKSTIAPGTTDRLCERTGKGVCFSPEFFGEGQFSSSFWSSTGDVPFTIVGGTPEARAKVMPTLVALHGPAHEYFQCSAVEAEIVKYMENSYLAMKVTFVNEFYDLCQAMGADWYSVREAWLLDPRMGHSHTAVFPEDRGFAGRCLPKDVSAIIHAARERGFDMEFMRSMVGVNARIRGEKNPLE